MAYRYFPKPATGHMPFAGHRTVAEWSPGRWCTHCERMVGMAEAAGCASQFCKAKTPEARRAA